MSNIWIAGATGLVGNELALSLFKKGHQITVISRSSAGAIAQMGFPVKSWSWADIEKNDPKLLESFSQADALINLSGDNVGDGTWSESKKKRILESRVQTTRLLGRLNAATPCPVWIQAGAVGIFGDRKEELLNEVSLPGDGFLAQVCKEWEETFWSVTKALTTRTVLLRIGMVLAAKGGALQKMRPAFEAGIGGRLGSGNQWVSWIHIQDLVGLIEHALLNNGVTGVVHAVAPQPVQFSDFAKILAKALGAFHFFPVPEFALKALLGEMSEIVLASTRVTAKSNSYSFKFETLADALKQVLGERIHHFSAHQWFDDVSLSSVFDFFSNANNLEKITPAFLGFKILHESPGPMAAGKRIEYKINVHGIPLKWRTKIETWMPPVEGGKSAEFVDLQLSGPYQSWHHTHRFTHIKTASYQGVLMEDEVAYQLPVAATYLGPLGLVASEFIRRDVSQIFKFRTNYLKQQPFTASLT